MKKILAFALMFALVCPALAAEETVAVATTQAVDVDGRAVTFETYALLDANGFQTNYAKLRDVAHVLSGTPAQFAVDWSERGGIAVTTGARYTDDGTEMTTPYSGDRHCQVLNESTTVNGERRALSAIRLFDDNGNGYTYYKLRDLGAWLGFQVDWSEARGVYIDTAKLYSGADRTGAAALAGTWTGTLDLGPVLAAAAESQSELKDYFHFDNATAPVTLTADAMGNYTLTLREEDFDAALAQGKAAFVQGAVDCYAAQLQETLGMTLEEVLTQSGVDRQSFEGEFAQMFDQAMLRSGAKLLSQFNTTAQWTADQTSGVRTGQNTLTLALGDKTKIEFARK